MSRTHSPAIRITRTARMLAFVLAATAAIACSEQAAPTAAYADADPVRPAPYASLSSQVLPIVAEPLTLRHTFTDDVAVQVRLKPDGRPAEVINLKDASNTAVVRFTVQPGVRFPWHSHPGLVMVSVTHGELIFVYADDCVERRYPAGTAFVDPGFGNLHYAFNRTAGETVIVATFLGVPPAPAPLTNPADPETAAALDAKCQVAAAMAHTH
jgi:quercetin dioxygenase-like cupin family protein